jgi:type IV secretory pathway VirD2 relaxase
LRDDRHHFRFIVSPEDAVEMADLKSFTRDLMSQMEKDLGTKLDWVAVDHWNTDNPHVHIILRGVPMTGRTSSSRATTSRKACAPARDLITQELGPRTDLDIRRALERQVEAERWTQLDRQLARDAHATGVIDMAPDRQASPTNIMRSRSAGCASWNPRPRRRGRPRPVGDRRKAEATLRELGERGDIIKRMHRALTERGIERGSASYVLPPKVSIHRSSAGWSIGSRRRAEGTAYAVVDGVDGRTITSSCPISMPPATARPARSSSCGGSMTPGATPRRLAVRSDLDIERQVTASGATWLDRQNIAREPVALSDGGFGAEVRQAMDRRAEHLVEQGSPSAGPARHLRPQPDRHAARRELEALARSSPPRPASPSTRAAANMSPAPIASASRSPPAASP